jgi:phosphatidylglycerophosphatase A
MNRAPLTFLVVGLIAGIATVAIGRMWPMVLVNGVGLFFFAALLAAIAISRTWSQLRSGLWRYLLGVAVSTLAYLVGLFGFSSAWGYSQNLLGASASHDISDFGADVVIGLLVAAVVSSVCIELLALILTGRWSNRFLLFLILAGFTAVGATYVGHLFSRQPLAFFGIILPAGETLYCWIVGLQISQSRDEAPLLTTVRT